MNHPGETTPSYSEQQLRAIQSRSVKVLALAQILGGLGTGSALSMGVLLAQEMSGSTEWAGSTTVAFSLSGALLAVPLARAAQRFGRRKAMTAALLTATLGAVTMAVAPSLGFVALLVGAFLMGLGNLVGFQTRFAAVDLAEPSRRGRDLSIVMWAVTLGAVAGPNLSGPGALVARALGMHSPLAGAFVLAALASLTSALVIFFALRPDPLLVAQQQSRAAAGVPQPGSEAQSAPQSMWSGWKEILANKDAVLALVASTLGHFVMVVIMAMTPVFMNSHTGADAAGHDHSAMPDNLALIGVTISLHIAGMFALSPVMGWLSDKLGPRLVILIGHCTLLVATLVAGLGRDYPLGLVLGLVLLGLGWSASMVASSALLGQSVQGPLRTTAQGSMDALMNAAGVLSAGVAGVLLVSFGFLGLNLLGGSITLIVLALTVVGLWRNSNRELSPV